VKRILPIFLIIVVIFTFAGCSNNAKNNDSTSPETHDVSQSSSTNEYNKSKIENNKEAIQVKKTTTINITVGNTIFAATLEDNETAKAFVKQLPLIVDMSELNGNEKYNYLSSNLRSDASAIPGKISEGDLMLYGDNCLVLFYKTFNTSYSYVKIGHIDDTTGLNKALGLGNMKVTFSVSEFLTNG